MHHQPAQHTGLAQHCRQLPGTWWWSSTNPHTIRHNTHQQQNDFEEHCMSSQVCDQLLALDELCQQAIGDTSTTPQYVGDDSTIMCLFAYANSTSSPTPPHPQSGTISSSQRSKIDSHHAAADSPQGTIGSRGNNLCRAPATAQGTGFRGANQG